MGANLFRKSLPIFQVSALVNELGSLGVNCKVGNPSLDIATVRRPYFERWLLHRDGFIKMYQMKILITSALKI